MADVVMNLIFKKLVRVTRSRKLRLNVFELAALAFALRVPRTATASKGIPEEHKKLVDKLENYRMRAKRATIQKRGGPAYADSAMRWKRFVDWMRFNFVHLPRGERWYPRRRFWSEQRQGLAQFVKATLDHYAYEPLTEPQMSRFVKLFKEELRRRRHPIGLRELLNAEPTTQYEFVFSVLQKKIELRPTANATWPLDILLSNRAERFKNRDLARLAGRNLRPTEIDTPSPPAPTLAIDPVQLTCPTELPEPSIPPIVADWLHREVPLNLWSQLREACEFRLTRVPGLRIPRTATSSVEEVIVSTRPEIAEEDRNFSLAELNFFADWLLAWILALISDRARAVTAVVAGFALAVKDQPGPDRFATLAQA